MENPKQGQKPLLRTTASTYGQSVVFANEAFEKYAFMAKASQPDVVQRLREHSITTVEEVVAIARVRPEALQKIVGAELSWQERSQLREAFPQTLLSRYDEYERLKFSFGAKLG